MNSVPLIAAVVFWCFFIFLILSLLLPIVISVNVSAYLRAKYHATGEILQKLKSANNTKKE